VRLCLIEICDLWPDPITSHIATRPPCVDVGITINWLTAWFPFDDKAGSLKGLKRQAVTPLCGFRHGDIIGAASGASAPRTTAVPHRPGRFGRGSLCGDIYFHSMALALCVPPPRGAKWGAERSSISRRPMEMGAWHEVPAARCLNFQAKKRLDSQKMFVHP